MLERRWGLNGMHYSRTLEAWLARQDAQRAAVLPLMEVGPWWPGEPVGQGSRTK